MSTAFRGLRLTFYFAFMWCLTVAAGNFVTAQDEETDAKPKADSVENTADTLEIKPDLFRIEVELKGHFSPVESYEVVLRPQAWSSLKLAEVVPHGASVKQGDVILQFEADKLAKQIEESQRQLRISEIGMSISHVKQELAVHTTMLDREQVKRQADIAQSDLEQYQKIGRSMSERSARYSLQSAEYRLEYAQEEFNQLKKMYEADELTEETEEIVLKRTERDVESAKFYLESSRINNDRQLSFRIPNQAIDQIAQTKRATLAFEYQARTMELTDLKNKLQLESAAREHEKLVEQLQKLEADLATMVIHAPIDGVVYYGAIHRGRSSDAASAAARMRPGSSVPPGSVILTLVAIRPLQVDAEAAEKDLFRLAKGQTCRIAATAFPNSPLRGHLKSIAGVPSKPGAFDTSVSIEAIGDDAKVMPGMAATVTVTIYDRPNAITVPLSALEDKDGITAVHVFTEDQESERRLVRVGKRSKEKAEILEGLRAGEKILTEVPE